MSDVIAAITQLIAGLFDIIGVLHPTLQWLALVTIVGWAFVFPLFVIIRRVVFSLVLKPDSWNNQHD